MRTYRLQLGNSIWQFSSPLEGGWVKVALRVMNFLALGSVVLGLIMWPMINYYFRPAESMYIYYMAFWATWLTGLAIWKIILFGWRYLIDPALFLPILIFSFIILSGLLFAPANVANTFGKDGAKFLSAVAVMSAIAIYYFGANLLNGTTIRGWLLKLLVVGSIFTNLLTLSGWTSDIKSISLSAAMLPFLLLYFIHGTNLLLRLLSLASVIISAQQVLNTDSNVWIILSVLIVSIILVFVWLISHRWQIDNPIKQLNVTWRLIQDGKKPWIAIIDENSLSWIVVFILVWLVLFVNWGIQNQLQLINELEILSKTYTGIFQSMTDVQKLFFGRGAGISLQGTTAGFIIAAQGLIGLSAYLILGGNVIYMSVKNVIKSIREGSKDNDNTSVSFILMPLLLALPILSGFIRLTTLDFIIWWSGIMVLGNIISNVDRPSLVMAKSAQWRNYDLTKLLTWWRLLSLIVILAIVVIVINALQLQVRAGIL